MLDPEHVRANAFAAMCKAIAVAFQPTVLENDLMIAIAAMHRYAQRLAVLRSALETLRLLLVAMRFSNQAVQMRLEHADILAHRLSE